MRNKERTIKFVIAMVTVFAMAILSLPGAEVYAASNQENSETIAFGTEGLGTLQEIEEDEIFTNDEALLDEEERLDEEATIDESLLSDEPTSEIVTFATNGVVVKYHFIDTTGSGGGDATMIEAKDRFYLVDGGPKRGYPRLQRYLSKHCNKKNGKIQIQVAIVTHNHTDHYEGIRFILNDTDTYNVKKVLKSPIMPNSDLNAACKKSEAKNGTIIETLKIGEIIKLAQYNGTQITVYGPSDKFENVGGQDGTRTNNLSMIVRVDSLENLIIMGDLYYAGFNRALQKYGTGLFSGDYAFCKVGHHGIRNGGESGDENVDKLNKEIKLYKDYINADHYIFTSSNATKNNPVYKKNYIRFKKGFGVINVDETSVSGNISIDCDKSGYRIDREK